MVLIGLVVIAILLIVLAVPRIGRKPQARTRVRRPDP